MSKLIYIANVSLDGYIEDAHGKFDFTEPTDEGFAQAVAAVAHVLAANERSARQEPVVTALLPYLRPYVGRIILALGLIVATLGWWLARRQRVSAPALGRCRSESSFGVASRGSWRAGGRTGRAVGARTSGRTALSEG